MADETGSGNGSKQRVAFELMHHIKKEAGGNAPTGEEEILALYYRCLRVVSGHPLKGT